MKKAPATAFLLAFLLVTAGAFGNQCALNNSCAGAASCTTAAFGAPLTNPSLIIAGGVLTSTGTISSTGFTDSGAGAVQTSAGGSGTWGQVLTKQNTSTGTTGITLTGSAFSEVFACEVTGAATATAVDGFCKSAASAVTGTGGTQNMTCSAALTPTGSDYIFAYSFVDNLALGSQSAGTGFTARVILGALGLGADKSAVSTSITPTASDSQAGDAYGLIGLAIKPSGGGGGPTPCRRSLLGVGC